MYDENGDVIKQKIIEKKIGLSGGGIQDNKYYRVAGDVSFWNRKPTRKGSQHTGLLVAGDIIKIDKSDSGAISLPTEIT